MILARHKNLLGSVTRLLVLWLVCFACVGVIWRYQLRNHFLILHGDRYDTVIVATILEHWYHVFRDGARWTEVGYYYPYARTIAQTDAYSLIGVAYFPFRFSGLDPYLSAELVGIVLKVVGFFGAWWMSRRVFDFPFGWSLLLATMFALCNAMTAHEHRLQLATVALAPVMATMLWITLSAFLAGDTRRFRRFGATTGILYGAWCLTCFYMAWFFCFFTSVLLCVAAVVGGLGGMRRTITAVRTQYSSLFFVVFIAALAMAPFAYAFLPKAAEVGVRSYETVAANTIPLEGILQVGRENFLFGRLYNAMLAYASPNYQPNGEYYNTGISPAVFFLFSCGVFLIVWRPESGKEYFVFRTVMIATLLVWIMALNVHGSSGWYFVYQWFPGAKALNVVSAIQIFLALPVLVIAIRYLSRARTESFSLILIIGILLAGEINNSYQAFDRNAELDRVKLIESPPKSCKVFYVSGWRNQDNIVGGYPVWVNNFYAHNVSAMLISQFVGIPTINGVASFSPKDWDFGFPNNEDYDYRVLAYANRHGVKSLCKLDLNTKRWTAAASAAQ